ncbi:MAG: 2-C-methyl-D-erythritol 4-phosphate cytidylyltransferase [Bacteroidetes bacterium]|nr:2-C-methyl-D-erythritol 4-phosphate cytidylyltransferase [Bacteroidota bacterium]
MAQSKTVIILAGGIGQRMGQRVPKQFLLLDGMPILYYSLKIFKEFDANIRIILVLPEAYINDWKNLCVKHQINIEHKLVKGGTNRFFSVKNGVENTPNKGLIAIHDGVRPLVDLKTIRNVFETADSFGSAVPVIEINESVRELTEKGNRIINRKTLRLIQTPQVFHSTQLKKAYQQSYQEKFTDDANVVEASGEKIYLSEGNYENIKITRSIDLKFAEAILNQ